MHPHRLVEEQDQAERRQHLVEVIALVERAEDDDLERDADRDRRRRAAASPSRNEPVAAKRRRRDIGADHVERAVRQVDHVHDAEDQRQPGRHQEQHDPELHPVQHLLDEHGSWPQHRGPGLMTI